MSELRRDPIVGQWVVFTGLGIERSEYSVEKSPLKHCPFCVGNEKETPPELLVLPQKENRKPNSEGWQVRVVPNKYPVLSVEGNLNREGIGIFDRMNGIGANEIIIETPEHFKDISELTIDNIVNVLLAYKYRMLDLKNDIRLKYSMVYRNWGFEAGAHIDHAHSILVATPTIPQRIKEEFKGAHIYYEYKERCIFCDILHQELHDRERIIYENDKFVVLSPWAARFPYEMWLLPKQHNEDFKLISEADLTSLAKTLKIALNKMNLLLDYPPYNYILHTASNIGGPTPYEYHWHIEIIPRVTKLTGLEWGAEYFINPVYPEKAAKELRETVYNAD